MLALDFGCGVERAMLARAMSDVSISTAEKRREVLMGIFLHQSQKWAYCQRGDLLRRLVPWGVIVRLVEKFAYGEIDQVRPAHKRSMTARRHDDQLPFRQGTVYLGIFFD
jgi:hypothetical protein